MKIVEYALLVQRTLMLVSGASFLFLSLLILLTDPYQNPWLVALFWFFSFLILTSVQAFLFFWWFLFVQRKILTQVEVNNILYQSAMGAGLLVYLACLWQIKALSYLQFWLVVLTYGFYLLFLKTKTR